MTDSRPTWRSVAGTLFVLAGVAGLMGIITAQALYPGYSTADNMISDLGGSEPPGSIVLQPSAAIFDLTMVGAGVLIIAGALCLHVAWRRLFIAVPVGLFGIGVLGVGLCPADTGTLHDLFAQLAFVAGAVAAILAVRVTSSPFRFVSVFLGAVSLGTLVVYSTLGDSQPMAGLGRGGVERWVAYPIVLWLVAFGGYVLGGSGRAARS